jgi:non-ribosomal peptide synthetase component F/SAM-dependent methyltransferase/acyl carrier protein
MTVVDARDLSDIVAALFAEVLGVDVVDPDDDFFAIGGHSLLAVEAITRLEDIIDRQLDVSLLFENATINELVAALATTEDSSRSRTVPRVDRSAPLPLSTSQARLWRNSASIGDAPFFNVPCCYRLRGPLDVVVLHRALNEIVVRHEALRTTFPVIDETPMQVIGAPAPVPIEFVDLTNEPDPPAAAADAARQEARRQFDLEHGPLLRVVLLTLAADDHVLGFFMHHIISDGSSMRVLGNELAALYEAFVAARPSPLPELAIQYADYSAWQAEIYTEEALAPHVDYWRRQLERVPVVDLPVDRPRVLRRPYAAGQFSFTISEPTVERLRELANSENATLFMVLLAALQTVVARTTGASDIPIGSAVANRPIAAAEPLIGFFVNTVVLRTQLNGAPSFREVVRRARRVAVDAFAHQDAPFDTLIESVDFDAAPGCHPLFQLHFQVAPMPLRDIRIGDLTAEFVESSSGATPIDLLVHCFESSHGVEGFAEYAADLFDRETVESLLASYLTAIETFAVNPDLDIWDAPLGPASEVAGAPLTDIPPLEATHRGDAVASDPTDPAAWTLPTDTAPADALTFPILADDGHVRGVPVRVEELDARVAALQATFPLSDLDRVLHHHSSASHLFVGEVLWPLAAGAHVVDVGTAQLDDDQLADLISTEGITCLFLSPDRLAALVRKGAFRRCTRLRRVFCTGDGATIEVAHGFFAQSNARLHFAIGTPETGGLALFTSRVTESTTLLRYSICAPGIRALIADDRGRPTFAGGVGQLVIDMGTRVAATGLTARVTHNGSIEVLRSRTTRRQMAGRVGSTLGLEALIRARADVANVAVVAREDTPGHSRLVAYFEAAAPTTLTDDPGLAVARVADWQKFFDTEIAPDDATIDDLATRLAAREPAAVLDIGCGSARLARKLAGSRCEYVGTDVSAPTLDRARAALDDALAPHVVFHHREADDFSSLPEAAFDIVVVRHVVDFFPDRWYLERVVEGALRAARPGGVVNFARVQDLDREPAPRAWRETRTLRVDPSFFTALAAAIPRAAGVEVNATGDGRYDVLLQVGDDAPEVASIGRGDHLVNDPLAAESVLRRREQLTADLARDLGTALPVAFVPDAFLIVDEIARTADGQPDLVRLPVPPGSRPMMPTIFRAPSTPTELVLVPIVAEALGLDTIGADDDFFMLGGHSLLVLQIVARIGDEFEIELDPAEVFETSTVGELARAIDDLRSQAAAS